VLQGFSTHIATKRRCDTYAKLALKAALYAERDLHHSLGGATGKREKKESQEKYKSRNPFIAKI
jgi:hypothetical protein